MHHICSFLNFVCHLLFSFVFYRSLRLFSSFLIVFLKKCVPPSVGSIILKVACTRNLEPIPFWASNLAEKVPSLGYLLHVKISKIHWKKLYLLLMALLRCAFRVSSAAPLLLTLLRPQFSAKCCSLFGKVLPALGGKHTFASCFDVRSSKKCSLALPFRRKVCIFELQFARGSLHDPLQNSQIAVLGVFVASQSLQNPLEKCVFPVYGLYWGVPFSIVCTLCMHLD